MPNCTPATGPNGKRQRRYPSVNATRRLRRDHPRIGIVAVCDTSPVSVREPLHLARAGIDEVVLVSMASRAELSDALQRARSRRRGASVWQQLAPFVPTEHHELMQLCLSPALERRTAGALARQLGIDRSTLAARLVRAGLPSAHAILSWTRLIAVSDRLASSGTSVEQAALSAGFGSATALRAFTRRLVGAAPRTVIARGGSQYVVNEFRRLLQHRHDRASSPRDDDREAASRERTA